MSRAIPAEASSCRPICVLPPVRTYELLQSSPSAVTPITSAWSAPKRTHQRLPPPDGSLRSLPFVPKAPWGLGAGPATVHHEFSNALGLSNADHHVDQKIIACLKKPRNQFTDLDLWHRFTANSAEALIYADQTSQAGVPSPGEPNFSDSRKNDSLCANPEKESAIPDLLPTQDGTSHKRQRSLPHLLRIDFWPAELCTMYASARIRILYEFAYFEYPPNIGYSEIVCREILILLANA